MFKQREQLSESDFHFLVRNTPLPAIDLCVVFEGSLLLGNRRNQPLMGDWFVPGACVRKGEYRHDVLRRIAACELGIFIDPEDCKSMGLWDHFYDSSVCGDGIYTHYVCLPHVLILDAEPQITANEQHDELRWFPLSEINAASGFHEYISEYAHWIVDSNLSGCARVVI